MIEMPRALARCFRAVMRKSVVEQPLRGEWPLLLCRTGNFGLRLFTQKGEIGIAYHVAGRCPTAVLGFRPSVLAQFEGRSDDRVILEEVSPGKGQARWMEGGIPRLVEFETVPPEKVPDLPRPPAEWSTLPSSFLPAFDEAGQTTTRESGRFALTHIQLRGQSGEVIASDGRQLLMSSGFTFPWKDNVLVPRVRAFGMPELASEANLRIGRNEQQVVLAVGPWTVFVGIENNARYPEVREVIPRPTGFTCRLRLDPTDAEFLVQTLPKLPGQEDDHAPVTVDLNGKAVVRARGQEGATTTDVELGRSTVEGKPVRLCLDRTFLRRALLLGCTELGITSPDKPVLARSKSRLYVMMPLDKTGVIAPGKDAIHIASTSRSASPLQVTNPRRTTMSIHLPNGQDAGGPPDNGVNRERGPSIVELITEAEELRNLMQDASTRLSRLLAGLKQHRRQSRAVQAAMQSLRQLKLDG